MRRQKTDLAAVDSRSTYDLIYDILRFIELVFLIELTALGRINSLQQPSLNLTGENK